MAEVIKTFLFTGTIVLKSERDTSCMGVSEIADKHGSAAPSICCVLEVHVLRLSIADLALLRILGTGFLLLGDAYGLPTSRFLLLLADTSI